MSEEFKEIIMSHLRKDVLSNSLKKGERFDQRKFDEFRSIEIQKSVIKNAEGSAFVKLGNTQVLVGVKFDVVTPYSDRPNEGTMVTNAELLPLASSTFEPGPPDENSVELARVVDRGIRSAECIDVKSLFIEEGKVLSVYIDLYVLDHSGNFIDASSIAAIAALTDTKVPKVEDGKIIRKEHKGKLDLKALPVTVTSIRVDDFWLVDPTIEEELAMDSRLTIATTGTHVAAVQKGKGSLTKKEFLDNLDIAFKRGNDIRKLL
ncbi:exosome complex protein Rrp42 [Candidatus Micrarchaeota archaeon]|nr:exosome complex protein Rrp42 [Candidatus Micrarchaeota archaeon]